MLGYMRICWSIIQIVWKRSISMFLPFFFTTGGLNGSVGKGDGIRWREKGLTTDQAIEQECYSIGEAIGNCLELNEDFIERYCGEKVSAQLLRIPEREQGVRY